MVVLCKPFQTMTTIYSHLGAAAALCAPPLGLAPPPGCRTTTFGVPAGPASPSLAWYAPEYVGLDDEPSVPFLSGINGDVSVSPASLSCKKKHKGLGNNGQYAKGVTHWYGVYDQPPLL